ncbi:SUMF1/EgtB/PvdO family nonheme iron enzyme [Luteolibacter ambystomatis]|uniref:SUMF1/EgtB/PvdO family nonheme iron enzyme n=1 Tax=Luteolibacter ambystomatis TaxID=2824561 RepID=A0A975G6T4_9BACT|nr:SUMF1/EgtB/PvdO family nonheme iron enzyme [Luteolibacter ambystomatis]QUE49850.1 SUMF1/EgtB/PvdO family nonheme iron enzyme [Luteolibacter ambystomatis]
MQRSWLVGMPVWVAACLATANETKTLDLGGGVTLEVVRVEAGTFTQGSPDTEEGRAADESQRQVTISQPFWIGRSSVTVGQWKRFISETGYRTEAETGTSGGFGWNGKELVQQKQFTWKSPGFGQSPDDPVCLITFPDASEFCSWLSKKGALRITLPTEAQWEYACRAGSTAAWHDGTSTLAAAGVKTDLTWHKGNSNNSTHATASTASNLWGIRIGGNVSEWCLDWYAPYTAGPVTDPLQTNQNLSDKPRRVLRGGSWIRDLKNTRSAARYRADPRSRNADIGFRIAAPYQVIAEAPTPAPLPAKSSPSSAGAPDPAPLSGSTVAYSGQSPGFSIGGLACLLIPLGAVVAIVVAIVKTASRRSGGTPPPFPSNSNNSYLPPAPAVQHQVRMTEDGFWLQTDAAAGTPLDVTYRLADGVEQRSRLTYQPGPQGHFVFTGRRPLSVSIMPIVAAAAASAMASRMFNQPPPMQHSPLMDDRDDDWARPVPPPRNPAAY